MHKYDPKSYTIICFSKSGRRKGGFLRSNYQDALEISKEWDRTSGGSSVVLRCLRNSALLQPYYPEDEQEIGRVK